MPSRLVRSDLDCPADAELRAYLLGDLDDERADRVAAHIDGCPDCDARCEEIDSESDPVVAALRLPSSISTIDGDFAESATSKLPPAPTVGGRYIAGYELLEEVGRGGMGVVFRARQIRLNRIVALKMILAGPFARPDELVRFHVEGEMLARLTHSCIVQIYEIGQSDGRPYFAMEWVEGGTLADRLKRGPLSPADAAEFIEQLALAAQHAHDHGIVHRDLKPANIMLANAERKGEDGEPTRPSASRVPNSAFAAKITDFGLAKPTHGEAGLTETGLVVGTPSYMAPEQARGDRLVGPTADVYSLGAILYELLAGRPPFPLPSREAQPVTPAQIVGQVLDRDPVPPRQLAARLPRDLATICLHCLEKDPRNRYATAAELADDLRRFRNGETIRARRSGEFERVWKWAKRRPVIAGLAAAVVVSMAAGTAVSTYFGFQARSAQLVAENRSIAAIAAGHSSQRQLAQADFQEGVRLAELGRVGEGMHWMLAALGELPAEEADQPFRELIGLNLTAWGERLHRLQCVLTCPDEVYATAFSPDGRTLAVGGHDRTIRLYDTDTGQLIGTPFECHARVRTLAFSHDGRILVTGGDAGYQQGEQSRVCRWDVATRREVTPAADLPANLVVTSLAVAPDGQTFLVGGPSGAWVCRTDTGQLVGHLPLPNMSSDLTVVAARTNGPGFVVASLEVGAAVHLAGFDGITATAWVRIAASRKLINVAFDPSGRLLLTDAAGLRAFWAPDGTPAGTGGRLAGHFVVPSPDGQYLAVNTPSARSSIGSSRLRLVDATTGETQAILGLNELSHGVTFSPDGRRLAAAAGGTVRVWNLAPLRPRPPTTDDPGRGDESAGKRLAFLDAVFSQDRSVVAFASSNGGVARVWRAGRVPTAVDRPQHPSMHPNRGHQIGLSPDGRRLTSLATGAATRVWDIDSGRPLSPLMALPSGFSVLATDPTGKVIASGDYSWRVCLWDAFSGHSLGPPLIQSDIVFELAFTPDGNVLAVSTFNDWQRVYGVRLWDVAGRRQIGELIVADGSAPARLAFSPDGAILLTLGSEGVRRWDTRTGGEVGHLLAQPGGVTAVAFTPDGRQMLTGSRTGLVRLTNAATGEAIGRAMPAAAAVTVLEVHPAARLVAVGYADGTARVWDTLTGQPVGPPVAQPGPLLAIAFPPDGRVLRTAAADGTVRDWPLPTPFTGDPAELEANLVAWTGLRMTTGKVLATDDTSRRPIAQATRLDDPYESLIADAEQVGDAVAARWHLDRWIAGQPNDWLFRARRARTLTNNGQLREAATEYDRATSFAPAGAILAWYRQRIAECRAAERWEAAEWYLNRLIVADPTDWRLYADRAEVFAKLKQPTREEDDENEAVRRGGDGVYLAFLADLRARKGQWADAADLFGRAAAASGRPVPARSAIACLKTGDAAAYRRVCVAALDAIGPDTFVTTADAAAGVCALGPAGLDDYARPLAIVERAITRLPVDLPGNAVAVVAYRNELRHSMTTTVAGLLIRSGRPQEGIDKLIEAIRTSGGDGTVYDWVYLALAHAQLGRPADARKWLDKVRPGQPSGVRFWPDWEVHLIFDEVESRIDGH